MGRPHFELDDILFFIIYAHTFIVDLPFFVYTYLNLNKSYPTSHSCLIMMSLVKHVICVNCVHLLEVSRKVYVCIRIMCSRIQISFIIIWLCIKFLMFRNFVLLSHSLRLFLKKLCIMYICIHKCIYMKYFYINY